MPRGQAVQSSARSDESHPAGSFSHWIKLCLWSGCIIANELWQTFSSLLFHQDKLARSTFPRAVLNPFHVRLLAHRKAQILTGSWTRHANCSCNCKMLIAELGDLPHSLSAGRGDPGVSRCSTGLQKWTPISVLPFVLIMSAAQSTQNPQQSKICKRSRLLSRY